MSQYKTGVASVTNGSPTVTGSGTLWLANVSAADSFTIAGDGVMYDVASVDSDTQVTLSVPYAGSTAAGAVYTIARDFTSPDDFPEMSQGDIETATVFTRAMRKIQGKITSILAGGSDANFTTMPQVGGDPIVESGSNANGEYTKFADGTLITRVVSTIDFSQSLPALDKNTAATFSSGNFSINCTRTTSGSHDGELWAPSLLGRFAKDSNTVRLGLDSANTLPGFSTDILITCIGRWS